MVVCKHCQCVMYAPCTDVSSGGGDGACGSVQAHRNNVKSAVTVIERTASERGLSADDIITLVMVATSNKLSKFDRELSSVVS